MSQRSYQGEKTAKSSGAYQTSPSMPQTWNKQASISQRHPVGIANVALKKGDLPLLSTLA